MYKTLWFVLMKYSDMWLMCMNYLVVDVVDVHEIMLLFVVFSLASYRMCMHFANIG